MVHFCAGRHATGGATRSAAKPGRGVSAEASPTRAMLMLKRIRRGGIRSAGASQRQWSPSKFRSSPVAA